MYYIYCVKVLVIIALRSGNVSATSIEEVINKVKSSHDKIVHWVHPAYQSYRLSRGNSSILIRPWIKVRSEKPPPKLVDLLEKSPILLAVTFEEAP